MRVALFAEAGDRPLRAVGGLGRGVLLAHLLVAQRVHFAEEEEYT